MRNLVIIGAGSFGREVGWLVDDINKAMPTWDLIGYVDQSQEKHGTTINGVHVHDFDWLESQTNIFVICAIADPFARKQIIGDVVSANTKGLQFAVLIHPNVVISPTAHIQEGSIICAGCIISVDVHLGAHCIVDHVCTIGHDANLAEFVTLYPGCNISGYVIVEQCSSIGTGTQIIQNLTIRGRTFVGAGSVVVRDLPADCIAVGVPAKPIKFRSN